MFLSHKALQEAKTEDEFVKALEADIHQLNMIGFASIIVCLVGLVIILCIA
jgi:hypothetical protein